MADLISGMARRLLQFKADAGFTAPAALAGNAPPAAQAGSAARSSWQPAHHAEDNWLDEVPGTHRLFFDTTTPEGFGEAIFWANNYLNANKSGYGVEDNSLAIVICARHHSTAFAYSDAIWAKYGAPLAERDRFNDPKTTKAPVINVYRVASYGNLLRNNGVTLDSILDRGVRLAVCRLATRARAGMIARQMGGTADEVFNELASHLVPNARIVPAGIVAVNRAQERGYTFASAG
jgi:intracellular sulfur oxidation DsrE/DsrF family protein